MELLVTLILGTCDGSPDMFKFNDIVMQCDDYYNNCVNSKVRWFYGGASESELVRLFNVCKEDSNGKKI